MAKRRNRTKATGLTGTAEASGGAAFSRRETLPVHSKAPAALAMAPEKKAFRPFTPLRIPFRHEIPAAYNETYLSALPRDPRQLFVFWEIAPDAPADAKDARPSDHMLRLSEVSSRGASPVGTIPVDQGAGSQYVRVPEPGRQYFVEYGTSLPDGAFFSICSSATVSMPCARVSPPSVEKGFRADTAKLIESSSGSGTVPPDPGGFQLNNDARLAVKPDPIAPLIDAGPVSSGSSRFSQL
jgi:hypothetical protein